MSLVGSTFADRIASMPAYNFSLPAQRDSATGAGRIHGI